MASFVILRDPVTTLVRAFNKPDKVTNDLLIFKLIDQAKISYILLDENNCY